jgi:hypothetical protein
MKLKCPKCPAEVEIGPNCDVVGDSSYKLKCPLIAKRLITRGGSSEELYCLNMVRVQDAAIRTHRCGK